MSTPSKPLVQPYLSFEGRAEEAINFYQQALGAEVLMKMHFKDSPDQSQISPASKDKVMHATLRIGDSIIMASDGHCTGKGTFQGISLSLVAPTPADSEKFFNALAVGGQIQMPLTKTFFSPSFGMITDKFGVTWMVIVHDPNMK